MSKFSFIIHSLPLLFPFNYGLMKTSAYVGPQIVIQESLRWSWNALVLLEMTENHVETHNSPFRISEKRNT